jgi:hypothetical protein
MGSRFALSAAATFCLLSISCSEGTTMPSPTPQVQAGPDAGFVTDALDYWAGVLGVTLTTTDTNVQPRILFREGTDGLGTAAGRALIDGADPANWATSGLVVVRPGVASRRLYRHEMGHALGFLEHSDAGLMAAGGGPEVLSDRERRMMVALYSLPAGTRVEPGGVWLGPQGETGQLEAEAAGDVLLLNINAVAGLNARRPGVTCRWASPVRVFVQR